MSRNNFLSTTHTFVKQFLSLTHNSIMAVINNVRFLTLAAASGDYSSLSIITLISPSVSFVCWHSNLLPSCYVVDLAEKSLYSAVNKPLFCGSRCKNASNSSLSLSVFLSLIHQCTLPTIPMNSNILNKERSFAFSLVNVSGFSPISLTRVEHK